MKKNVILFITLLTLVVVYFNNHNRLNELDRMIGQLKAGDYEQIYQSSTHDYRQDVTMADHLKLFDQLITDKAFTIEHLGSEYTLSQHERDSGLNTSIVVKKNGNEYQLSDVYQVQDGRQRSLKRLLKNNKCADSARSIVDSLLQRDIKSAYDLFDHQFVHSETELALYVNQHFKQCYAFNTRVVSDDNQERIDDAHIQLKFDIVNTQTNDVVSDIRLLFDSTKSSNCVGIKTKVLQPVDIKASTQIANIRDRQMARLEGYTSKIYSKISEQSDGVNLKIVGQKDKQGTNALRIIDIFITADGQSQLKNDISIEFQSKPAVESHVLDKALSQAHLNKLQIDGELYKSTYDKYLGVYLDYYTVKQDAAGSQKTIIVIRTDTEVYDKVELTHTSRSYELL